MILYLTLASCAFLAGWLVYCHDTIDDNLHSGFTEVTSKVGWTFRF